MCTWKSIQDAIQECCQSQYDMDAIETDHVLQSLPFSLDLSTSETRSNRPKHSYPYRRKSIEQET